MLSRTSKLMQNNALKSNLGTAVIGGGIGGVANAYILSRDIPSSPVTLLEPSSSVCNESSTGMSGVLSPYHTRPRTPKVLLSSLLASGNNAAASEVYINTLLTDFPATFKFGAATISHLGTAAQLEQSYYESFEGALLSVAELLRVATDEGISLYSGAARSQGVLNVFESAVALATEREEALKANNDHGYNMTLLTREEVIEREPQLAETAVVGGSLAPEEFVSECKHFADNLVEKMQAAATVDFHFNSLVTKISDNEISVTSGGVTTKHTCERIILCNSHNAGALMQKQVIEPVYGYSVTFDNVSNFIQDLGSLYYVTAAGKRRLFSRFKGNRIRLAGLADIGKPDGSEMHERFKFLKDVKDMHSSIEFKNAEEWIGYRPMSPDGNPIVGRSSTNKHVWWSTGLGNIGYIQSFGAALKTRDSILHGTESPFSPKRFGL